MSLTRGCHLGKPECPPSRIQLSSATIMYQGFGCVVRRRIEKEMEQEQKTKGSALFRQLQNQPQHFRYSYTRLRITLQEQRYGRDATQVHACARSSPRLETYTRGPNGIGDLRCSTNHRLDRTLHCCILTLSFHETT